MKKTGGFKLLTQSIFLILFCLLLFQGYSLLHPSELESANLTSASVTMSNSRLSYKSSIGTSQTIGDTTITIDTDSADDNTNHLFPGDTICFVNPAESGCIGNKTYTIGRVPSTTTFTITDDLDNDLTDTDFVVATQSGTLTVAFTTTGAIPTNGDILITIPALQTADKTCDGIPDTAALASNGFDLKSPAQLAAGDISTTGCTDANWVATETITCATGANDHTIRIDRQTTTCAGSSAITVTIGSTNKPVNPAPESSHAQGTADPYTITIQTRDGTDAEIDTVDVRIAPVEAVFVSATVEEVLTFAIAGVGSGSTDCGSGASTDVTTYAYSVPLGSLTNTETFYEAEQQLTVTTNADGGYKVYTTEDDELGKDGADSPLIADTPCDSGPCTHTSAQEWVTATNNGFGYSLQDSSGTDAKFEWDDNTPTTGFKTKQFPNESELAGQYDDADAEVMINTGPVSGSSAYVCYRISVDGTQEAGYYYNKIWYIATATF